MYLESIYLQITTSVPYWQGKRIVGPVIKSFGPAGLVQVENRASKVVLLTLAAALSIKLALLIMLPYGLIITIAYEWLRHREKLPDPMETNNLAKGYLLGFQEFTFAKGVRRFLRPERSHLVKIPAILVGAAFFGGVVPVHHYNQLAGYTGVGGLLLNVTGRLVSLPTKFLELSAVFISFDTIAGLNFL